ncbi:MAG: sugar kinase [Candidatus Nanopelagicales bacterium]
MPPSNVSLRSVSGAGATRRIVVIGDVMADVVARTDVAPRLGTDTDGHVSSSGGGSGANTACWLAYLGHPVSFIGTVGADPFGVAARDLLEGSGVDVRLRVDPTRATGICVVLVGPDRERTMIPDAGANRTLSVADLAEDLFVAGDHLHVSGYSLLRPGSRAAALVALRRAHEHQMTTSLDAASAGPIADVGAARVLPWLIDVDLLLANGDEARALSAGLPDGVALDALGADVVVKLGSGGASWSRDGASVAAPALLVPVVDTTGAGDAFAAGFLPTYLEGSGPAAALHEGVRTAALAVSRTGARPQRPNAQNVSADTVTLTRGAPIR